MKKYLFILQILLLLSNLVFSQKAFEIPPKSEIDYFTKFDNYTVKQGLSSNNVAKIIQDNNGFLWFATDNGLSRYDGYKFIVFKNNPNDSNSISDNNVTSLAADNFNNLWIGTRNGLNKLDLSTHKITRFYNEEKNKNSIANNWVRALLAGKEGFLYIETTDGTLHKYDIQNNKFKFFKHSGGESEVYPMHQIYQDKEGIIWIGGTTVNGLVKFDTKKEILTERVFKGAGAFCTLLEDRNNNFFLGSSGDKIHLLDRSRMTLKEMPLTSIYKIMEDDKGNIWFGGYSAGARKYNLKENKLTMYKHNSDNPNSIIDDQVIDIYEDKSGCIWFATKLGLSKLSYKKYKFEHYFHIAGNDKSVSSNRIYSCANDNDSVVWLGTFDNGLDKFNRIKGEFKNYKFSKDPTSIASNQVTGIAVSKNKNDLWISLWNGFDGGALNKFDKKKQTFIRYNVGDDWLQDVISDSKNNVWSLGWGWGTGLSLFNKAKGEPDTLHFCKNTVPWSVNYLKADNNNLIWFGYGFYNKSSSQFYDIVPIYKKDKNYNINLKKYQSVPNYIVLKDPPVVFSQFNSVVIDKQGNDWLCYDNGTLIKSISATKRFEYYTINESILATYPEKNNHIWIATKNNILLYNPENNKKEIVLKIENIRSFLENNNILWLASDKSVYKYNTITKQLLTILNIPNALISISENNQDIVVCSSEGIYRINCDNGVKELLSNPDYLKKINGAFINCVYYFKNDQLFIGTGKGLFLVNLKNKETIKYMNDDKNEHSVSGNNIMSIDIDKSGSIWVGSDKGLSLFKPKEGTFDNYTEANKNSLTSGQTSCALEDKDGNMWVGTSNAGLNKINLSDKTVQHFYNHSYDSASISDKAITCIFQDSKGIIWVGTENGLNKLEPDKQTFKHYTINNGFPDNFISGILEDNHNNLWVSTANGLVKFNIERESVEIFTLQDGLQDNEFSKACCKFASGEMFFGGYNGFNIFHPDSIKKSNYLLPIGITAMLINDSITNYSLSSNSTMELPYEKNNISFEFSAFDYNFPEKNKYSYILEGFDSKWTTCDASVRIAKYTNVPEGKYVFKLKAANHDGFWNTKNFIVNIVISPPWWRTWWFRTIIILLIFFAIYCFIKWREYKLNAEKRVLERKVEIRTQQLREEKLKVEEQKEEIILQKEIVEEKNKDITDSINYAKRIQRAMLPHRRDIWDAFPQSFVLFKPKDIVSGDFYFFQKALSSPGSRPSTLFFIAAADCTGHGVPGAFMSLVGAGKLNDAVHESSDTSEILSLLNKGIKTALKQSEGDQSTRDGMDIALCSVDIENCIVKYAAANRPIWIIRKGQTEIEEIKATKKAIGGFTEDSQLFETHEIKLQKGDTFYLSTDGYADTFSGKNNKKLTTKKFKQILLDMQNKTMQEQEKYLNNFIEDWKAGTEQVDDILVIGVRL